MSHDVKYIGMDVHLMRSFRLKRTVRNTLFDRRLRHRRLRAKTINRPLNPQPSTESELHP